MRLIRNIFLNLLYSFLILSTLFINSYAANSTLAPSIVAINVSNDGGDYTYFDSNYCYTSGKPAYTNLSFNSGNNYIELYRLDYKNPKRKGFIYIEKTDKTTPCYFDINMKVSEIVKNPDKRYDNILMSTDFKTSILECESELFFITDSSTNTSCCIVTLSKDGKLIFADGTSSDILFKKNTWANLKVALKLSTHIADIYLNQSLIKTIRIPENIMTVNKVNFGLVKGDRGNMFFDNLSIVGLVKPYKDGIETPTSIYPDDIKVESFLEDKIGFHAYGQLIYKNKTKTLFKHKPIIDENNNELYISTEDIKDAFDIVNLNVSDNNIIINGKPKAITISPRILENITYIPLKCFAEEVLGKFVFSHISGFYIVSDKNEILDTSMWTYPISRTDSSQITLWNDVDFLNAFLQYERPDCTRLKKDLKINPLTSHPRILLNNNSFETLRMLYKNDYIYREIASKIIDSADADCKKAVLTYKYDDNMRMLNTARELLSRFSNWGYAYNITRDKKYLTRAYQEIIAVNKFPDFNTSHIIDTGTYAMALSIAYDWFYNGFTENQRSVVANLCHNKLLKPLASGMYGRITSSSSGSKMFGAFKWKSNYNAIVIGGCINAALATIELDEEYCLNVIKDALRGYEYTLSELMPNGGWNESPIYWNETMKYLGYGISTLNICFGTNYGLSNSMGINDTLKYAVSCFGPGGLNNFHDNGTSYANSFSEYMCLAKLFNNKTAYDIRLSDIKTGNVSPTLSDVLFYLPNNIDDTNEVYNTVNYTKGTELFSVRDTFDSTNSKFYFSTHFGTTSGYHQHNDCGTFVLDIDGVRWAEDLGSESYNLQNELDYHDYMLYRKRAEGHNVIVINPEKYVNQMEQIPNIFAPIYDYKYTNNQAYVIADLSDVYSDVSNMKIGYFIDIDKQSVTMRNEFAPKNQNSKVYWFMHTKANIDIVDNKVLLTRDNKVVELEFNVIGGDNVKIEKMRAVPLPTSPNPNGQNPNDEYSKVAISFKSSNSSVLTVKISPQSNNDKIITTPLKNWILN